MTFHRLQVDPRHLSPPASPAAQRQKSLFYEKHANKAVHFAFNTSIYLNIYLSSSSETSYLLCLQIGMDSASSSLQKIYSENETKQKDFLKNNTTIASEIKLTKSN